MDKITRYSLYSVGAVIALIGGAVVYVSATFDANALKPRLTSWVQAKTQRTLRFDGPVNLKIFPKPSLSITDISLSERNSETSFVQIANANVVMQFWPLLSKRIVIDEVGIDGATVNLIKEKSGNYNFTDLINSSAKTVTASSPAPVTKPAESEILTDSEVTSGAAPAEAFRLSEFSIAKSTLRYHDQGSGQQVTLSDLSLFGDAVTRQGAEHLDFSSRVQSQSPALDLKINTKLDRVTFDDKTGQILLDGLSNVLDGKLATDALKLTLTAPKLQIKNAQATSNSLLISAQLTGKTRKADANLRLDEFSAGAQQIKAKLVKLSLKSEQDAQAINVSMNSPFLFSLPAQTLNLSPLTVKGDASSPELKSVPFDLTGKLGLDLKGQRLATVMKGSLDNNMVELSADVKSFTYPAILFAGSAQSLDLNRYLKSASTGKEANIAGKGSTNAGAKGSAVPVKVDLSAFSKLDLDAKIQIGQLRYTTVDAKDVRLALKAQKGLLSVPAFSMKAFGGDIAASGSATASTSPRITLKPQISNVDIYALLKQFAGFEKIEGKATVNGDLTMQGGDTQALKNSLSGNIHSRVIDGAWRGINLAKTIREAKAAISSLKGGEQSVSTNAVEKTDFTELSASVLLNQGIASNKDLSMKSPLLRVSGEGEVNLRTSSLNYLLKATVVDTSKGQMGAERDKLHGVTVPVRIKGALSEPKYSLDLTAAIKENAGAKLDEVKQEAKQKLEEKRQEVQKKAEQKAGAAISEGLKKLF